jgi:hypothetical protein
MSFAATARSTGWKGRRVRRGGSVSQPARGAALERLNALVGEWEVQGANPFDPSAPVRGMTTFTWLEGEFFLLERSTIEHDDFPDSVSIIGCDDTTGRLIQSYSDSRGVYRIYEMSLDGGAWKLWRAAPSFSQRFTGTFSDDGRTIAGPWERSSDGSTWEHDFDLTYTKVN